MFFSMKIIENSIILTFYIDWILKFYWLIQNHGLSFDQLTSADSHIYGIFFCKYIVIVLKYNYIDMAKALISLSRLLCDRITKLLSFYLAIRTLLWSFVSFMTDSIESTNIIQSANNGIVRICARCAISIEFISCELTQTTTTSKSVTFMSRHMTR